MAPVQPWISGKGYWGDRFQTQVPIVTPPSPPSGGSDTRQTVSGVIDGSNKTFTLPSAPDPNNLKLYVNGFIQINPDDYTLSGLTITLVRAPQPAGTNFPADVLVAYYGTGGSQRQLVSGTINGSNKIFILPSAPSSTSLQFFWNGSLQFEGVDYTLSGNQVTMTTAPKVTSGISDVLVAYF